VIVKCLVQEHHTVSPARARTRSARSGDERTNHEATAPPLCAWLTVHKHSYGKDLESIQTLYQSCPNLVGVKHVDLQRLVQHDFYDVLGSLI